jgi:hypothetical protein
MPFPGRPVNVALLVSALSSRAEMAYPIRIPRQEARMRRLLLLTMMMMVSLAGAALAADNPPPAGNGQGQGHDCHKPKPPETS